MLLALSAKSFSSIWYWIITFLAWMLACHVTLGVPFDILVRAERDASFAQDAEEAARIQVRRVVQIFGSPMSRMCSVAAIAFFLAVLATFGFYYGYEVATASFMLIAPLVLVQILGVRLAFAADANEWSGPHLRAALNRRRFWNQVIGLFAITVTAAVAFITFVRDMAVWY